MLTRNASMLDIVSAATNRDTCVVMPTLEHAVEWWPRIQEMLHTFQPIQRSKTAILCSRSRVLIRLWIPYAGEPTQPMDFPHDFAFRCDYLLLYGWNRKEDIKWLP